ncbi:hypothetical protein [Allobaculum sp. JKK-2023]|uniref:hypothetical protein n=1 Tax=Allobaculum sp. JKK-2023 TaxID=3108943 RepID=UPI002B052577|nr:hypothetical protein [Allobaculum sp. JKK-2023]
MDGASAVEEAAELDPFVELVDAEDELHAASERARAPEVRMESNFFIVSSGNRTHYRLVEKFTKKLKATFHENGKIMVESAYMIFKFWKVLDFFDLFCRFPVMKRKNDRKTAKKSEICL